MNNVAGMNSGMAGGNAAGISGILKNQGINISDANLNSNNHFKYKVKRSQNIASTGNSLDLNTQRNGSGIHVRTGSNSLNL